jgi:hypothetical protein
VDCYLRIGTLMVGFFELGNPTGKSLTLSQRSHLSGNTPNIKKPQVFTCEEKVHVHHVIHLEH